MNIILASAEMFNNIDKNLDTLTRLVIENRNADLIVFGEVFLHGFDALKWSFEKDKSIALSIDSEEIDKIKDLANQHNIAISFSFFEKYNGNIYTSNIVIDKNGGIIDLYHRVSPTWTIENVSEEYKSGDNFHTFELMGKSILVAVCGDLWFDKYIKRINKLKPDIILWPLYIDYSVDEWESKALEEYNQRASMLCAPVLMVNSYMRDSKGAVGGAYLFSQGKVMKSLNLGDIGSLSVTF